VARLPDVNIAEPAGERCQGLDVAFARNAESYRSTAAWLDRFNATFVKTAALKWMVRHVKRSDRCSDHPEAQVKRQLRSPQPAISVENKKKESVGDFKNSGRELRPAGKSEQVRHDFITDVRGCVVDATTPVISEGDVYWTDLTLACRDSANFW
jgi:hypothetical protein